VADKDVDKVREAAEDVVPVATSLHALVVEKRVTSFVSVQIKLRMPPSRRKVKHLMQAEINGNVLLPNRVKNMFR
jgi:hypothetical protein